MLTYVCFTWNTFEGIFSVKEAGRDFGEETQKRGQFSKGVRQSGIKLCNNFEHVSSI